MGKAMEIICRLEGMSKNIVDDARFEKVLSFLESNLRIERNLDELFMDFETVREGHFLETFQNLLKHSDERVVSVACRLVGILLTSLTFAEHFKRHDQVLDLIFENSFAASAAKKFGALECLRSIAQNWKYGAIWLLKRDIIKSIELNLSDTNILINRSCSNLITSLFESLDEPHAFWILLRRSLLRAKSENVVEVLLQISKKLPCEQKGLKIFSHDMIDLCFAMAFKSNGLLCEKWSLVCIKLIKSGSKINLKRISQNCERIESLDKVLVTIKLLLAYYDKYDMEEGINDACLYLSYCFGHVDRFQPVLIPVNLLNQNITKGSLKIIGWKLLEFMVEMINHKTFRERLNDIASRLIFQEHLPFDNLKCIEFLFHGEFHSSVHIHILSILESRLESFRVSDMDRILKMAQSNISDASVCLKLEKILEMMMKDYSWKVRDLALQHMAQYLNNQSFPTANFNKSIAQNVLSLLFDEQMYVRISSLKILATQTVLLQYHNNIHQIWMFLNQENEALVLFESLGVILAMVSIIEHVEPLHLFLSKLYNHEDYSNRLLFLEIMQGICKHVSNRKHEGLIKIFDNYLEIVVKMIDDPSRSVRRKTLEFISFVMNYTDCKYAHTMVLVDKCKNICFKDKWQRCEVDDCYRDILEPDESITTEKQESGEGNNVLFCYDC